VETTARDKILEVLDSIRPAIQADGGDVELVEYRPDDGVVEVRLLGACESCPISMMTLKEGIERRIKSSVPEVAEVTAR
jgi:Fe-S cluster biogenesis protein NfuA